MSGFRTLSHFLPALFALLFALPAFSERKVALVIGNADYEKITPLVNPVNDATVARDVLSRLGFETATLVNANKDQIEKALEGFREVTEGADVALLYFAGHGIQADNKNYLLGIDTDGASLDAVASTSVNMDKLIDAFAPDVETKLLFVDACRNNPFATRSLNAGDLPRGLARSNHSSADLLVVYAAQPSRTALDGDGENSPFVEAISDALASAPEVRLNDALIEITNRVRTKTRGRQIPYIEGSLSKNLTFSLDEPLPQPTPAKVAACEGSTASLDSSLKTPENFTELSGTDPNILVDDRVNICIAPDRLQVSGPFSASFPCEAFKNEEGVGYYYADASGEAAHIWFYVDPASAESVLEMGLYRGEEQLQWVWTGTQVCR